MHAQAGALGDLADAEVHVEGRHGGERTAVDLDRGLGNSVRGMTHPTADDVLAGVDLTGRTAIVTGGTRGSAWRPRGPSPMPRAGRRRHPPALCRSTASRCDGSISPTWTSVRAFAAGFGTVDIVIANAGIMACPETRVGPGWEAQFAANHLGHFALVNRLWPALIAAAGGARVVAVSSGPRHHAADPLGRLHCSAPATTSGRPTARRRRRTSCSPCSSTRRAGPPGYARSPTHPGAILTPLQRHLPRAEMVGAGWIDEARQRADP